MLPPRPALLPGGRCATGGVDNRSEPQPPVTLSLAANRAPFAACGPGIRRTGVSPLWVGRRATSRATRVLGDARRGRAARMAATYGFGRLTSASTNLDGTARAFTYQYDADGNRTRVTHPDGTYCAYVYDGLDRPVAIQM